MANRREFLGSLIGGATGALVYGGQLQASRKLRMAVVTTLWQPMSHAWHMAERFLVGYPINGHWHKPNIEVVSAYVDQRTEKDLSRKRAEEFGFKLYPTIAETLRCGGDRLAVDAVLVIGEHGNYPLSEIGQKKYPRYEFFKQVVEVFQKDGRVVPVFNDKHLSWNFDWAKEMVDISHEMNIPFLAGSSLPVTWRMPDVDVPLGAELDEVLCVAIGGVDIYDFHALETIQCMTERRKGGETGVVSMHALGGAPVWEAMAKGSWSAGGWDPRLFEACLSRSQTLTQPESFSHRYPTQEQIQAFVKEPLCYRFEYADGLKATMLLMNGLVGDFNFAARIKGRAEPLSTMVHLPPNPNVTYSAALMSKAEEMFVTGVAPYPVERTLLTSGLVTAGMTSLAQGKRIETPHLAVKYQPPKQSQYART